MEPGNQPAETVTPPPDMTKTERIRQFILDRKNRFAVFGSVCGTYVRCGKPNCRCSAGQRHGPYYCLRWRDGDGKAKRFYLGGPEEAEFAKEWLLKIRRERWSGCPHYWVYRRYIQRGLVWVGSILRVRQFPTQRNAEHCIRLKQEMDEIEAQRVEQEGGEAGAGGCDVVLQAPAGEQIVTVSNDGSTVISGVIEAEGQAVDEAEDDGRR